MKWQNHLSLLPVIRRGFYIRVVIAVWMSLIPITTGCHSTEHGNPEMNPKDHPSSDSGMPNILDHCEHEVWRSPSDDRVRYKCVRYLGSFNDNEDASVSEDAAVSNHATEKWTCDCEHGKRTEFALEEITRCYVRSTRLTAKKPLIDAIQAISLR